MKAKDSGFQKLCTMVLLGSELTGVTWNVPSGCFFQLCLKLSSWLAEISRMILTQFSCKLGTILMCFWRSAALW